jgi:hypothetical protein
MPILAKIHTLGLGSIDGLYETRVRTFLESLQGDPFSSEEIIVENRIFGIVPLVSCGCIVTWFLEDPRGLEDDFIGDVVGMAWGAYTDGMQVFLDLTSQAGGEEGILGEGIDMVSLERGCVCREEAWCGGIACKEALRVLSN